MNPEERWGVVVHNDDHTPFVVVHHLLRTVCELDTDTALAFTRTIHENGSCGIGTYDRETAESITVRLVRTGLRAELRRDMGQIDESVSVRPVDGGVQVTVSTEFARGWEPAFQALNNAYRPGSYVRGLHLPRPMMLRRALLRKMFPDVSGSRWQSASFRRRHRKVLADRALVNRVWEQWLNADPITLTPAQVHEWIVVFGQIRALYLLVRKVTPLHLQTLGYVQHQLVWAVDPEACPRPHDEPVAAGGNSGGLDRRSL